MWDDVPIMMSKALCILHDHQTFDEVWRQGARRTRVPRQHKLVDREWMGAWPWQQRVSEKWWLDCFYRDTPGEAGVDIYITSETFDKRNALGKKWRQRDHAEQSVEGHSFDQLATWAPAHVQRLGEASELRFQRLETMPRWDIHQLRIHITGLTWTLGLVLSR